MKFKHLIQALVFFAASGIIEGQQYASLSGDLLTLDNGVVRRVIQVGADNHGIISKSYSLTKTDDEFLSVGSEDFYFEIDGKPVTGLDNWNHVTVKIIDGENKGNGAMVILEHPSSSIRVSITYMLYPELPVIRKKISFFNTGQQDIKLEALDIEDLQFGETAVGIECWVLHDYAREKSLGQYIGNCYDPVVVVHEVNNHRGFVLGNEAPGVMKRTTAFLKPNQVTAGLTHPDQNFGFRKWLKPGEPWESSWVFTAVYDNSDDPFAVLNSSVSDFVRRHLGIRLNKIPEKPVFVYNTWEPFLHNINDKMVRELAAAAAECGIEEFVIDDGWQDSYGDWGINKEKFPDGLKPVFDYIKSKGMKPGVWISLGAAESKSNVYKNHPEWLVRKADGSPISLHADFDKMYDWETYSMCMTTGWYDYIKGVILNLIKEHGLEYIKGDFAVVTGAYTSDKTRSGCYATTHPMHRDRNESMLEMYQRTWQLFDDLHKEAPGLFIDCTFETMGAQQLIDLDMCKHAEGNWLSNFGDKAPLGSMRVRQMSWWRTPVIPATAMVIGNQRFDDPEFELSLMSLAGSLPIVLGDPRLLSKEQRARMKSWADWLRTMQTKHDFMSFRQDLKGYGEPAEGNWDGYQRINSETQAGGIIGIFRQGSPEIQRTVTVNFLDPSSVYEIRKAPSGELIMNSTGKELSDKGFVVKLDKKYDGAVFEIVKKIIK
jgi:alpha-galactosidase